jgi:hypothetical protein
MVAINTYGTVVGVQALIGDVVINRVFSPTTFPTFIQVETFLDYAANRLNASIRANGYTFPVDSIAYPETYGVLKLANEMGAASLVISMSPSETWIAVDSDSPMYNRRRFYDTQFKEVLRIIKDKELYSGRSAIGLTAYAGSQENRVTGDEKFPIFTRQGLNYPGGSVYEGPQNN